MKKLILLLTFAFAAAIAAGCFVAPNPEDRAVELARADLARHLGVSEEAVELDSVEEVEWASQELSLPATKPGPTPEASIPAVPGWAIVLKVNDDRYEYRVGDVEDGDLLLVRLDYGDNAGAELAPERERNKPGDEGEVGIPKEPTWPPAKKTTPTNEATID